MDQVPLLLNWSPPFCWLWGCGRINRRKYFSQRKYFNAISFLRSPLHQSCSNRTKTISGPLMNEKINPNPNHPFHSSPTLPQSTTFTFRNFTEKNFSGKLASFLLWSSKSAVLGDPFFFSVSLHPYYILHIRFTTSQHNMEIENCSSLNSH